MIDKSCLKQHKQHQSYKLKNNFQIYIITLFRKNCACFIFSKLIAINHYLPQEWEKSIRDSDADLRPLGRRAMKTELGLISCQVIRVQRRRPTCLDNGINFLDAIKKPMPSTLKCAACWWRITGAIEESAVHCPALNLNIYQFAQSEIMSSVGFIL